MPPITTPSPVLGIRVPTDANAGPDFAGGFLDTAADLDALASKAAGSPGLRTLGTGSLQAAAGNDARLSDERVPTDGSVTPTKLDRAYLTVVSGNATLAGTLTLGALVGGGDLIIEGATGAASSAGRYTLVQGGNAGSGSANGGNAYIRGGTATGGGTPGSVLIQDIAGSVSIGNAGAGTGGLSVYGGITSQAPSGQSAAISTASGAGQVASHLFWDGGTPKWQVYKASSNAFAIRDMTASLDVLTIGPSQPVYFIPTQGVMVYYSVGTSAGYAFQVNGSIGVTGSYATISDQSVKDNVETIDPPAALELVKKLRPVAYNHLLLDGSPRMHGLIAQEVNELLPEATSLSEHPAEGDESMLMALDYNQVLVQAVAAIQAQAAQIEALTATVADLQAKLAS